jgi:hypothetical protein
LRVLVLVTLRERGFMAEVVDMRVQVTFPLSVPAQLLLYALWFSVMVEPMVIAHGSACTVEKVPADAAARRMILHHFMTPSPLSVNRQQ